ncbi:DUF3084 domain-containing protein [uncultured Veillonella sp.]|uniref:DUF3084 domain-containing protein n=1 Tax=uncultured Veillonella sp. TaxID=159268 RepID=UPI002597B132|nr:DUF3084 domain-containing protein [uncultured Veillonella sp.]
MLVGLRIIIIVAIMGGIIAFIGDKLGTKIGKRRMSLFGLRPKHTSIIVTIVTGILIAAATLGILSIASQNVRTALFGMEQLKEEMRALNASVESKNKELEQSKKDIEAKTKELTTVRADIQATQAELDEARAARDAMSGQLVSVQDAYAQAEAKLANSQSEIKGLEEERKNLESHISDLQVTMKSLEQGITQMREGTVLFRVGEVLSGALVRPNLTEAESEAAIAHILNDTNGLILKRLGINDDKTVIYVSRANVQEVAKQIAASKEPMTIRISAAANIIYGEAALAEIRAYPYAQIFHRGDVIYSSVVQGGNDAQYAVLSFLKAVNAEAKSKGVLPDPLSGDVGSLPGDELFETIRQLEDINGPVKLEAIAREDTYTDGPVQIELKIHR